METLEDFDMHTMIIDIWVCTTIYYNAYSIGMPSGQISMEFGLVLSLSLETDVRFSLHDNLSISSWWL